jgi:hypothetical protein
LLLLMLLMLLKLVRLLMVLRLLRLFVSVARLIIPWTSIFYDFTQIE